jgi:hypothetical protein
MTRPGQRLLQSSHWMIDPRSAQPRKLSSPNKYAIGAHLSPDGGTVAWTGAGSDAAFLTLAPVSGTPPSKAFSEALGVVPGDFSPGGPWIAFGNVSQPLNPCLGP